MDCNKKVSISIPFSLTDSSSVNKQELSKIKKTISTLHPDSFQITSKKERELSIPILDTDKPKKSDILKYGLLICTRIEKRYKRSLNLGEIELKQTRLRWRQFNAILYSDRLELYHFTNRIINTTRLAYTIYLNKQYPYRPVRLSLIAPQDFIWSLEYLHYERKSWISFHFLSSKVSESHEWYMLIYQQLPNIVYYKKLIPSFVDIRLMRDHESPVLIRLPLQLLQYSQVDIPIEKLKSVLAQLLHDDLDIPMDDLQDIKLCWQPQHVDIKPLNIPWINELSQLVIPPLIEQSHQLELHLQDPPTAKKKVRNYDGLLIQKVWSEKRKKFRDRPYYALIFGSHLFFFDGPFYTQYKKELKRALDEKKTTKNNWFHVTTGILFQQRKIMISRNNKNETVFKSAPLFDQKSPTISLPDPLKLLNSHYMIDLRHQVVRAQSSAKGERLFEVELNDKKKLYYEAPNTQIMLQWITMINNSISLDHFLLFDNISYKKQTILLSGEIFMKEDYHGTFKRYYCVLSKDHENEGIMVFRMNDKLKQYEKHRFISLSQGNDYIYSGDECILDKLMILGNVNQRESSHYYANDHLVTGHDKTSDCVFVIWQMRQRHLIPKLREYFSLFKFGHRLGNRGKYWVFKARNKQERDEWIWALHFEIK